MKLSLRKMMIGTSTAAILATCISPTIGAVLASEERAEVTVQQDISSEESTFFDVVDNTTLLDKRDDALYNFDSNEDMINYIESSSLPSTRQTSQWSEMDRVTLSASQTQDLADDVREAQSLGNWTALAGTWIGIFGSSVVGGTVTTLGVLMQEHNQVIVDAANNNQSITIVREENTNWNGYGPRTRTRFIT